MRARITSKTDSFLKKNYDGRQTRKGNEESCIYAHTIYAPRSTAEGKKVATREPLDTHEKGDPEQEGNTTPGHAFAQVNTLPFNSLLTDIYC